MSLGVWPHVGCKAAEGFCGSPGIQGGEGQDPFLPGLGSVCASEHILAGLYGKSAPFRNIASPLGFNIICLQLGILLRGEKGTQGRRCKQEAEGSP